MMTPAETRTKANRVPTFTISSSLEIGNTVAAMAMRIATTTVIRTGASRLLVIASERGSSPSRAMANITRESPSTSTITTVVNPARAPIEMILAAQSMPLIENAVARLAWPPPLSRNSV